LNQVLNSFNGIAFVRASVMSSSRRLASARCRHIGIRGTIALQAVQQRQRYERSLCWLKGQRFKQNMVNVGIHGISLAIAIAMVKCTGLIRECITFFFLVGVLLYF